MIGIELPYSLEAEQTVIGAIIKGGLKTDKEQTAYESLTANSFHHPANQEIFAAMQKLTEKKLLPDLVAISDLLPDHRDYLVELFRNCTSVQTVDYYAQLVREKAAERRLIETLRMAQNTVESKMTHQEKLDRVSALIKDMERGESSIEVNPIGDYLDEVYNDVDELLNSDKTAGLPTGFGEIDSNIGGLVDGELVVLGARPSVGKSALGMNIAENVAGKGFNVLYITMEMSGKSLAGRVVCSQGRANNSILKTPKLSTQDDWQRFSTGIVNAKNLPIHIADMPKPSANDIKAVARNFKRKNELSLLVIDHLHLMRHDKKQGEVQGIADTTSELKGLAVELGIPILLMSQLNRGSAKENRPPTITDLRGSGAIEQDSDIVMLIHRDDSDDSDLKGKALVMIPKNRSGVKDAGIVLANNLHTYRFDNYSHVEETY